MTRIVRKPGEGQDIVRAATLVIKTQRIGAGKCGGGAIVDEEWIREAQGRDVQPILPGSFEVAEVRLQYMFVAGEGEALIAPGNKVTLMNDFAAPGFEQLKTRQRLGWSFSG